MMMMMIDFRLDVIVSRWRPVCPAHLQ